MRREITRIFVLHTGGTFAMTEDEIIADLRRLLGNIELPDEVKAACKFTFAAIDVKDSKNVGVSQRLKMAAMINSAYERHDAFIIIHGTDTLAYTIAVLSIIFKKSLQKSVFVIGSSRKFTASGTEVPLTWQNTVPAAIKFHKEDIVGTYNVCMDKVWFGPRLIHTSTAYENFESLGMTEVAKITPRGVALTYGYRKMDRNRLGKPLKMHDGFETSFETIVATKRDESPQRLYELAEKPPETRPKGIRLVLNGKGTCSDEPWQDTNMSWLGGIRAAFESEMAIVGRSDIEGSPLDFDEYDETGELRKYLINGGGMTNGMLCAKEEQALHQCGNDKEDFQEFLNKNFVGERMGDY